jgi:O-antigen/teichoic acid export membrane protein
MDISALRRKLLAGSVVGFLRVGLAVPVYLVLTPIMLSTLGMERFGLWAFSTMIINALNLADFGLKNSLVYHVAKLRDNYGAVSEHFTATVKVYLLLSSSIAFILLVFHRAIIQDLLHIPSHLFEEAQFLFVITVIAFSVRLMAIPYQAVFEGLQELSLSQSVFLVWLLIYSVAVLIALIVWPGIYSLGLALLLSNLFIVLGFYGVAKWRLPFLNLVPMRTNTGGLGSMLKYGVGIQVAAAAIALREPLYKIVLARSYDLATGAAFEVAYRLCTQLASVMTAPLLGVLGVSALLSRRHDDLMRILRPLLGYVMIVLPPAVMFAYTFSNPLFNLWLGQKGNEAAELFPGLFLGFAIYYSTEVFYKAIEGSGRSWYSAIVQVSVLVVQMSLLICVASLSWSIAVSLLIGFGVFSLSNLLMFHRCYGRMDLRDFLPLFWLAFPTCLYASLRPLLSEYSHVWAFLAYLVLHFTVLKHLGMVSAKSLLGLFQEIGESKIRQAVISR